jgi:hypothetical protein
MVNFCCFLIFIVIAGLAVKLFSKKVKELTSHGELDETDETDETGWRTAGNSQDSEDLKRRQAEHWAQRMAKQRLAKRQRDLSPEPPKISEIKSKLEEERQRLTELKRVQEEPEIEPALEVDLVNTEPVIETPESDPGLSLVEAVPSPEMPAPMPPEIPEVQDEVVDVKAIKQSSPEDEPTDDASVTVELFCETCMGEGVVSYDSEQIFKDQFEGQPVAWKGLLKSIDPLSYDRYFKGKEGFLATVEIYEITGRYETRPVLAVILLTPEQKAAWEPSLNQEMAFCGTLFALDAFGKKVYLNLQG